MPRGARKGVAQRKRTTKADLAFSEPITPEIEGDAGSRNPATPTPDEGPQLVGLFEEIEVNADDYVRLYRRDEKTAAWVLLARLALDEADSEFIAGKWGGGRFRAQLCTRNEEPVGPRIKIARTREFILPGAFKPPVEVYGLNPADQYGTRVADRPGASPASYPTGGGSPPTTREALDAAVLTQVLDVMKRTQDVRPGGTNWVEILPPLLTFLGTVLTPLLQRKEDPGLAALRAELEALRSQPGPAASSIKDMLDAIKSIMGVKDMLEGKGDSDPDAPMWRLGERVIEALATGAKGGAPAVQPPQQPAQPIPEWQRLVRQYAPLVLGAAARNAEPETTADFVLQMLPSHLEGALVELAQRPDLEVMLRSAAPKLGEYPQWLSRFVAAIREALAPEEEPGDEAEEGSHGE